MPDRVTSARAAGNPPRPDREEGSGAPGWLKQKTFPCLGGSQRPGLFEKLFLAFHRRCVVAFIMTNAKRGQKVPPKT
jgi:hypothetical protein